MDKIGVIHGRFQMLHNGHMEYLMGGLARCEHLIIGICNPDPTLTRFDSTNPHRSNSLSNPLTYYERYEMIKRAMIDAGVINFDIVPFPINVPELIFNYSPRDAKYYLTIYDQWGERKKELLKGIGCDVEVMWRLSAEDRFPTGTEVRRRIRNCESWKELVPKAVYDYTVQHHIDERIWSQQ